jgi:hypothetical protein
MIDRKRERLPISMRTGMKQKAALDRITSATPTARPFRGATPLCPSVRGGLSQGMAQASDGCEERTGARSDLWLT